MSIPCPPQRLLPSFHPMCSTPVNARIPSRQIHNEEMIDHKQQSVGMICILKKQNIVISGLEQCCIVQSMSYEKESTLSALETTQDVAQG